MLHPCLPDPSIEKCSRDETRWQARHHARLYMRSPILHEQEKSALPYACVCLVYKTLTDPLHAKAAFLEDALDDARHAIDDILHHVLRDVIRGGNQDMLA